MKKWGLRVDDQMTPVSSKVEEREQCPAIVMPFQAPPRLRLAIATWLERVIFVALCLVALFAMRDPIVARWAFEAAFLLWIIRLLVAGRTFEPQPFVAPSLVFLLCAGISASLSYAPLLSWQRIGWFVLIVLPLVVAQNVRTMRQVKVLISLVLLAAAISALRTGWQYVFGVGTELVQVPENTALYRDGLRSRDFIQLMNGHKTRTPEQWRRALESTASERNLSLHVARGAPINYLDLKINRADLQQWLEMTGSHVRRARPIRAQGHLYHYMPYAGVLLQTGLLAFGLLVANKAGKWTSRIGMTALFALLVAALGATVTRIYLATLVLGCFLQFWLLHKKWRLLAIGAVTVSLICATVFIEKERGLGWLAMADAGTEYRVMMWKDAVRLIPRHLAFGVGPDSVLQEGARWNVRAYKEFGVSSHFHSTYIELAVDCGLLALAAWLWLMGSYLLWLARAWKKAKNWEWFPRGVLLGVSTGVIGFLLAGLVQYTLGDGEVMMLVWMFMGLLIATLRIQGAQLAIQPSLAEELGKHRPTAIP
jgi:hypothetical protein